MARFEYQRATSGAALAYSFEEEEPGTANDNDSDHLNPPREDTGGGHDTEDETAGAYTFSEIELLEAFELVQGDVGNIAFDWIVKGMIERGKAGILFGQNQSYKSFLIITLAVHIMAGMRFAGRRTKAKGQAFIYVPFEGKSSVNVRFREAMRAVGIKRGDGVALEMFHARPFNEPGAWEFFEAGLRRYKAKHGSISMVVVDTVNQARFFDGTAGSNENDPLAWGALYARLKALAVELDLTCLLVHHAGKSLENGGRGSSANTDDADFALTISTEKDLVTGVSEKPLPAPNQNQGWRRRRADLLD
ncbi:helicase RepA family protein [Rhizobium sp. RCAM05350]|nr:helicase RepA family protein [Rhizobium sp. RCAM05350]